MLNHETEKVKVFFEAETNRCYANLISGLGKLLENLTRYC